MLAQQVFAVVFPVFSLIALGYLFGRLKKIDLNALTDVILYVASPALAFGALARSDLPLKSLGVIAGSTAFVILAMALLVTLWLRFFKQDLRGLYLPTMFPNAGNMGLALALFAFGEEGLAFAVIFFATTAIIHYTLGLAIVSLGSKGRKEIFRFPLVYAALGGIIISLSGVELPVFVRRPIDLLGTMAIALMLFSLGYRLVSVRMATLGIASQAALLRIGGGFSLAVALTSLFGLEGTTRGVLILMSSMPSAVINFILAEKFSRNPELVASTVWVSTLLSLGTTPAILSYLL